jgi:hypothetical protein
VQPPPKETPLGLSELPPRNFYRYEFTSFDGLHVFMSVAAQRGRIYVCGATSDNAEAWEAARLAVVPAVLSFRLKDGASGPR